MRTVAEIEAFEALSENADDLAVTAGGCLRLRPGVRFPIVLFSPRCNEPYRVLIELDPWLLPHPKAHLGGIRINPSGTVAALLVDLTGTGNHGLYQIPVPPTESSPGAVPATLEAGPVYDAQWITDSELAFTRARGASIPELFGISLSDANPRLIAELSAITDGGYLLESQETGGVLARTASGAGEIAIRSLKELQALPRRDPAREFRCLTQRGSVLLTSAGRGAVFEHGGSLVARQQRRFLLPSMTGEISQIRCSAGERLTVEYRHHYERSFLVWNLASLSEVRRFQEPFAALSPLPYSKLRHQRFFEPPTVRGQDEIGIGGNTIALVPEQGDGVSAAVLEQLEVLAPDGAIIPVARIRGADDKPTLLRFYGAYGVSLFPELSPADRVLLKQGFSIAFAAIRGGSELGPRWSSEGRGAGKRIAVGDLLAVAEQLVTPQSKVVLRARSAAATIARAAFSVRPELFSEIVLDAPVLSPPAFSADEPRTEREEWGSAADRRSFEGWVRERSRSCTDWPRVLMVISDEDQAAPAEPVVEWLDQQRSSCPFFGDLVVSERLTHDGESSVGEQSYLEGLIASWILGR